MVGWFTGLFGQSPHGHDFAVNCADCHNPEGWSISSASWKAKGEPKLFSHEKTGFLLEGAHDVLDCKQCHASLIFAQASSDCVSCHTDMHEQTVGDDCKRCHNAESWTVDKIPELHEKNGFPLIGAHDHLTCVECHQSASQNRYDRLGNECINCHQQDYVNTQNPAHQAVGYSENCMQCHNPLNGGWGLDNFNHGFFPLTGGHDIDCKKCHTNGTYANLSADCVTCHQSDYDGTQSPNHSALQLGTDCASCHTTAPDWTPASFPDHDGLYFPIYSGSHEGEWDNCVDCHTNPNNYAEFSCTNCHANSKTTKKHDDVSGFVYSNPACFACHPSGEKDDNFNHDGTNFPLKGGHIGVDCNLCHVNGYSGTPTDCNACHHDDYLNTINPNHESSNFPTDCAQCHTEGAWVPASFDHNSIYPLKGAHANIANDCNACHSGGYSNTPNTCVGCHQSDYDGTNNPNHAAANFPTDCAQCHTEGAWTPASFDHDNQYFPIYSGKHKGEWNQCVDCHTNPNDYSSFSCIDCHEHDNAADLAGEHDEVSGYSYQSTACYSCHPNGDK